LTLKAADYPSPRFVDANRDVLRLNPVIAVAPFLAVASCPTI
jgi:hypothetical protein